MIVHESIVFLHNFLLDLIMLLVLEGRSTDNPLLLAPINKYNLLDFLVKNIGVPQSFLQILQSLPVEGVQTLGNFMVNFHLYFRYRMYLKLFYLYHIYYVHSAALLGLFLCVDLSGFGVVLVGLAMRAVSLWRFWLWLVGIFSLWVV